VIPPRISIVTIGAREVATLAAFYGRLGWKAVVRSDDGFTAFDTGGAILTLWPLQSLAGDAGLESDAPARFRGVTLAVNVDSGDQVDASVETARSAGATILKAPRDESWGGRSAYFADPEGNVWEVAWMPGSSFDDRGGLILPTAE
jgi:catechol 2,3-dioxygenase-like lactoylglutathione lyase family enzyme